MAELFSLASLSAFVTLAALEIVLGIDNLVFIAILSDKLPKEQQSKARRLGLALAALGRIILLFLIALLVTLEGTELFSLFGNPISVKDLILILGGLFLLGKATWEIHENLEGSHHTKGKPTKTASFTTVIAQILALDLVFSIDSVLTAVGMVNFDESQAAPFPGTSIPWPPLVVIIAAIVVAIAVMLVFAAPVSRFIQSHPTFKMLALSFLLLIGMVLVAEGFNQHISKGYIYAAIGFSLFVELLNLKIIKRRQHPAEVKPEG